MKIVFLADPLDTQYAGIHVYLKELLYSLHDYDQRNEYFIIRPSEKKEFPNWNEISVPIKSYIPFHQRIRQFIEIPNAVRHINADLVIEPAHFGPFNLPKKVKRITIIHDLTPLLFSQYHDRISYWAHKVFLKKVLKDASGLIVNSKNTQNDLQNYLPEIEKKIRVIYPGINPNFKPTRSNTILIKYRIDSPYLLFVGTLEPRKGVTSLISAFEEVFKVNPDYKLVLVGKLGWLSEPIEKSIKSSIAFENIILTGFVPEEDLPALYSMANVFVYPSHYEGFGFPILEAMGCGTPVLTPKNSSLPEIGGNLAMYYDNQTDLVTKLLDVLNSQRVESDVQNRIERARSFNWHNTSKMFYEYFNEIV